MRGEERLVVSARKPPSVLLTALADLRHGRAGRDRAVPSQERADVDGVAVERRADAHLGAAHHRRRVLLSNRCNIVGL